MKKSVAGNSLSIWDASEGKSFCNCTGVARDNQESVVGIDISGWSLYGKFPDQVCSYLPKLRFLRLGLTASLASSLVESSTAPSLRSSMSSAYLNGALPDLTPLRSLKVLDLASNFFSGDFPLSVTNLTNLEVLNFNENPGLNPWELPESITSLTKVKTLVLSTCMLRGVIPPSTGNMTSLVDLELSGNYLAGPVPRELGLLRNLQHLELHYNQLDGRIPEELGNLTNLVDLDMSVNKLSGEIPASICRLPNLGVLQLYNNSLVGGIPLEIANSTTLSMLSLYENWLTGEVPLDLG